jgi:hypothetical protein
VSFALELPTEVRRMFATLPFELQEAVLDKLDLIASSPPDPRLEEGRAADEAVKVLAGIRHYVFFMYARDEVAEKVIVQTMGHVTHTLFEPPAPSGGEIQ